MAVPSSGTLHLSKIANEKHFDNYDQAQLPTPPYSLTDISTSGNSNGSGVSFDATNTANAATDRPDGSTPHAMSEFYNYDHDKTNTWSTTMTVGSFGSGNQEIGSTGYGYSNSGTNPGGGQNSDGTFGSVNSALSGFNGATVLNLYWHPDNVLIITFTGTKPSFSQLNIGGTNYGASSTWISNGTNSWRKNQFSSPFGEITGVTKSITATF